nr:disease resistance protein RUN1-like [Ziziphus jujuba var. spinosa]
MDSLVNDFHSSLCESLANVRFIGICGISGIGKTTLAEVYYRSISNNFQYKSFLRNVKNVCEKKENINGLVYLQTQLLSDILEEKFTIADVRSGMDMIKSSLYDKKVLIVLDDVDTLDQLKVLAKKATWFGSGSIVIVTTKDESLLARTYEERIIYRVEQLKDREALQLFSWKSFENRNPSRGYGVLSRQMIEYANGVPLTLEVLGSFLWTKDESKWTSTLDRLREYHPRNLRIVDILQICFDELKELEKHIFLDIAYFFNGCQKDYVTKIMEESGFSAESGIIVLNRKSLLRIDENTLWMHELLQEMGREIVRKECQKEPEGRSRLWDVHYCP